MKINPVNVPQSFVGRKAFLLDGGGHGRSMEHFARAIFNNTDVEMKFRPVKVLNNFYDAKVFGDMANNLKELSIEANKGDKVIIPALALAPLHALEKGIKEILDKVKNLTPQNLLQNKNILIAMLTKMSSDEVKYSKQLRNFDSHGQEFQFLPDTIKEINNLINKGIDVYVPSGHPVDYTIKGILDSRGQRQDLYKYIATGKDTDGNIKRAIEESKQSKNYNVNLLALSNAHVVNIVGIKDEPYIYGAFDSLVNDKSRGAFNFCPIRDNSGKVKGFSFHDKKTPEYCIDEYQGLNDIANLLDFVGFKLNEKLASNKENKQMKRLIQNNLDTSSMPNKLYKISEIYDENYITKNKLDYLGEYIDKEGKSVYDVNKSGEILFQKCNCEGSERPSVVSMWGSCFASINAAKRDMLKS